jgi:hypothetical protein
MTTFACPLAPKTTTGPVAIEGCKGTGPRLATIEGLSADPNGGFLSAASIEYVAVHREPKAHRWKAD